MHLALAKRIRKHRWLFAGLCVIPLLLPFVAVVYGVVFNSLATTYQVPTWFAIIAFPIWPILVGLTGLLLFLGLVCLLELNSELAAKPRTKAYLILFAIAWNLVFGYFDLLGFGLGLDHAFTMEVVTRALINIVLFAFPSLVLLSLAICIGLVAVVVTCVEMIMWIFQKANPKIHNG